MFCITYSFSELCKHYQTETIRSKFLLVSLLTNEINKLVN